jgi:hypothetical protein
VSESTAHNIFTYWQKLFEGELPPSLLEQIKKCQEEEIIIEQLRDYELIVDSAEQPVERPTDDQEQKIYYSGKPRRHTFKSQFIVWPKAEDMALSDQNILRHNESLTLKAFSSLLWCAIIFKLDNTGYSTFSIY